MELFSQGFVTSVRELFSSPQATILATVPVTKQRSIAFVDELKKRRDVTLIEVSIKPMTQIKGKFRSIQCVRLTVLTGVSALPGCSCYRDVHLTGVSALPGCYVTGVFTLQGCQPYRGVHVRDVHLTGVSALRGCLPYRGVHVIEMFTLQSCPPHRGVHLTGLFVL